MAYGGQQPAPEKCQGFSGRRYAVSVSEAFQFIIMLCAVAMLFYTIGKDIHKQKKSNSDTKK